MQPGSPTDSMFLPAPNSTVAGDVDGLLAFVNYLSVFFFLLIVIGMIVFVWQYRRRPGGPKVKQISHNTAMEIAWSVIPTILVIFIFLWGVQGFMHMQVAPRGAKEYYVHAKKWQWEFEDTEGNKSLNELVIPVDTPVKLIMTSEDVIHSFYVPNFRTKMDVVPGRYTTEWFQATAVSENNVFCTEYCGTGHSAMLAKIRVLSADDYARWVEENAKGPQIPDDQLATVGAELYKSKNCVACHSVDGARIVGPTFKGLFGRKEDLEGGTSVDVDETYIRESINEPLAKVVKGYPPAMPAFKGLLKERQIDALVAYIKTLK